MFRRKELDYRTRETKLFATLQGRFWWDLLKVFVAILYPAGRLYGYLNRGTLGGIPIVSDWLTAPPWDTLGAAVLLVFFQYRNIKEFRGEILPRAESIAYKHGKRRGT